MSEGALQKHQEGWEPMGIAIVTAVGKDELWASRLPSASSLRWVIFLLPA